jgi:uncharacterized protein YbaR (Trm112 family)
MTISDKLLEVLACPKCKGDLVLNEKKDGLICDKCSLMFLIEDDIPKMLIEDAVPIQKK